MQISNAIRTLEKAGLVRLDERTFAIPGSRNVAVVNAAGGFVGIQQPDSTEMHNGAPLYRGDFMPFPSVKALLRHCGRA